MGVISQPGMVATAGRSGPEVRSDCRVSLEARGSGGLEIEIQSKVAAYYGEQIRTQAAEVLRGLGVEHARVSIEDAGALPFVLAARIEAAVRRAGVGTAGLRASGQARASVPTQAAPVPAKDRLRRSRLYLPGGEPKYFVNAALYQPDAIILDLEDSVHAAEKDAARILVRNALAAVDFTVPGVDGAGRCERMVRINQLPLGLEDLEAIVPMQPEVILIPKVERAGQVSEVDAKVSELLAQIGSARPLWLMPILESALGIENAFAIASASPRVCALTIGLEDYTADLGVVKTAAGAESLYARLRLVNAARAAGVQAIDSVYGDVGDMEGLARWAEQSRALGFDGMGCIHPLQIEVIHRAFAPSEQEIEKALRIVAAYDEAQKQGLGVVSLGSKMIDPPVVQRALKLVERAQQMRLVTPELRARAAAVAPAAKAKAEGGEG